MKKEYKKPTIEIERYELATSIASNCGIVVDMGPVAEGHTACDSYYEASGEERPTTYSLSRSYNVDFWENCDCYTSASGYFFTS